jgi:serine/threonine protein kinase
VHADLRPDHFFLAGGEWKLMDLSRVTPTHEPLPPGRGAQPLAYCAPEVAELLIRRSKEHGAESPAAPPGALTLDVLAAESLDSWGLGLTLFELFSGGDPLFPRAHKDDKHMSSLADGSAVVSLGGVRPTAARHLLEKLLVLEPSGRATIDVVGKHAWLTGGLDTIELSDSYTGLQDAQDVTQRQLARVQAGLRGQKKLQLEEEETRVRVEEERRRRSEQQASQASKARKAVISAALRK